MPLDNKCRIGPLAAAQTRVGGHQHSDKSGFITSVLSHSKLPEVGKNPVDTAYDVGSVVSVLADVGTLKPTSVSRLLMVSLDGTGCLEGGKPECPSALNRC
ncbi:hypothetical protein TNCV_640611 [Trichonephila clavipes]|nr:hypothetical protein TNCV_640611 [Trichonephila clavipes]